MKKTTLQTIAETLGVSRVTIWKALNDKPGVSQQIRQQAKALWEQAAAGGSVSSGYKNRMIHIALIVSHSQNSPFWMKIINQIATELLAQGVNLLYIYLTAEERSHFQLPAVILNGGVAGVIVMNAYDPQIIRLLSTTPVPKVFLDGVPAIPFQEMNGDVLLLDGQNSVFEIVAHLLKRGRRQLGFIGDVAYSCSNLTRWKGFQEAHRLAEIPIQPELCLIQSEDNMETDGSVQKHLCSLLDAEQLPDGLVCVSDYIAQLALQTLQARGILVPEQIVISGYDDDDGIENHLPSGMLTTVHVQNEQLGKRLVQQILYRIKNPEADFEVISIHSKVRYRTSTEMEAMF